MAKNGMAKYRIDCDEPGMQIPGAGAALAGAGLLPPNTIVNFSTDFEPRACMTPLNKAAEAAFALKRKKVEAQWRECLPKGQNPDGQELELCRDGRVLNKDEIESIVKREISKVGPRVRPMQRDVKKTRPKFDPSSMRVEKAAPPKPEDDTGDADMLPPAAQAAPGARASDN